MPRSCMHMNRLQPTNFYMTISSILMTVQPSRDMIIQFRTFFSAGVFEGSEAPEPPTRVQRCRRVACRRGF